MLLALSGVGGYGSGGLGGGGGAPYVSTGPSSASLLAASASGDGKPVLEWSTLKADVLVRELDRGGALSQGLHVALLQCVLSTRASDFVWQSDQVLAQSEARALAKEERRTQRGAAVKAKRALAAEKRAAKRAAKAAAAEARRAAKGNDEDNEGEEDDDEEDEDDEEEEGEGEGENGKGGADEDAEYGDEKGAAAGALAASSSFSGDALIKREYPWRTGGTPYLGRAVSRMVTRPALEGEYEAFHAALAAHVAAQAAAAEKAAAEAEAAEAEEAERGETEEKEEATTQASMPSGDSSSATNSSGSSSSSRSSGSKRGPGRPPKATTAAVTSPEPPPPPPPAAKRGRGRPSNKITEVVTGVVSGWKPVYISNTSACILVWTI